ncbi:MAG: ATP-binding cassette domain-containing protein [Mailhella sp.]|nr:ATP-binding cassette domain-containing protein [Mailhella sp.]
MTSTVPAITARGVTVAYGARVIQRDLNFTVQRGDIFIIMGGSGCGKSSLLRVLMGLTRPAAGSICYGDRDLWGCSPAERNSIMRTTGVMFQSGALWTSRTLAENVALPLERYTNLSPADIQELARLKLALVGLAGFENFYPSEISGGMKKRAGLARALALDPEIVYFDEPSAGLDPVSSARLDELIIQLRDTLGMTVVVVTHELDSIFTIASNSVFLDAQTKTMAATGDPHRLIKNGPEAVVEFLTRGRSRHGEPK